MKVPYRLSVNWVSLGGVLVTIGSMMPTLIPEVARELPWLTAPRQSLLLALGVILSHLGSKLAHSAGIEAGQQAETKAAVAEVKAETASVKAEAALEKLNGGTTG